MLLAYADLTRALNAHAASWPMRHNSEANTVRNELRQPSCRPRLLNRPLTGYAGKFPTANHPRDLYTCSRSSQAALKRWPSSEGEATTRPQTIAKCATALEPTELWIQLYARVYNQGEGGNASKRTAQCAHTTVD